MEQCGVVRSAVKCGSVSMQAVILPLLRVSLKKSDKERRKVLNVKPQSEGCEGSGGDGDAW